jgi:hypothetical protein
MAKEIGKARINAGSPADVFDRLTVFAAGTRTISPVATEGYLIKRADVTSISVKAWYDGEQIGSTQAPAVSSVIYDTLQKAGVWSSMTSGDTVVGGNAHYQIPASLLDVDVADADAVVRVEITLTMADGTAIEWWYDVTVNQSGS